MRTCGLSKYHLHRQLLHCQCSSSQSVFLIVKWQEEGSQKRRRGFFRRKRFKQIIILSQTYPKHIYFLKCCCAPSQRKLILQSNSTDRVITVLLCPPLPPPPSLFAKPIPSLLCKIVPNLTSGGEDRIYTGFIIEISVCMMFALREKETVIALPLLVLPCVLNSCTSQLGFPIYHNKASLSQ